MRKYNLTLIAFTILVSFTLLQFCTKSTTEPDDGNGNGGNNPPPSSYGIVLGTVENTSGTGLSGVTVTAGIKTATTNNQGWFTIGDLSAAERLQLTFTLTGYATTQKIVKVIVGESTYIDAVMAQIGNTQAVTGSTGGTVTTGGATVTFPPGSFSGDGTVNATYFDPTSSSYNNLFPGSFEGIRIGQSAAVPIESFGFMNVELKNASGSNISLTGAVTLTIPIPAALQATAPQTIPMWYYDTQAGYWKEEGSANRVGNTYVGTVTHFTSWNWDRYYDVAYLSGRVVDGDGNPIVGAYVQAIGQDYTGTSYRYTGSDGTFTIGVRYNSYVKVIASKGGVTSTPSYWTTPAVGQTTNIGDIVLAPPQVTITLTWGSSPYDLDSHLMVPTYGAEGPGHVRWNNQGSSTIYPYANLDTDDTNGYGPEVVTIYRKLTGLYEYYVYNYSGESGGPIAQSEAKINLVIGGSLYVYNVPTSNPNSYRYWHVFDLSVASGGTVTLQTVNTLVETGPNPSSPNALNKSAVK